MSAWNRASSATIGLVTVGLATVLLAGCAMDFQDGDEHFFVYHKGAAMPVWVTGAWRSDRIIVHVHGGPGTTNGIYYQKPSYQKLAKDYGIVYWEQRASGSAQGNHREHLTMTQWLEDLDVLMKVLRHRYPGAEFVLMGHSFGGFYGADWLLQPGRQDQVKAWIEQDGAHNSSCKAWQRAVDFVLARHIDGAAEFYRDHYYCDLETNENNMIEEWNGEYIHHWHSEYVRKAGGYDVDTERVLDTADTLELVFQSQFDMVGVLAHSPLPLEGYYGVDLTPRLGEITIPTLVLWGKYDMATPYAEAEPAFNAYGAPADKKGFVTFLESGHNPWAEESGKFYDAVSDFLRQNVWPEPSWLPPS